MLKKDSTIRSIKIDDIEPFFLMLCELDRETTFMMYEPGERRSKAAKLDQLKVKIERAISGGDLLLVVENGEKKIVVEGRRPKSMKVDGVYVDEFYMGKILRS